VLDKTAPLPVTRRRAGIAALLASVAMLATLAAAGPAHAAAPVPFTIADQVNFTTGVFTFTATGPLCASGTFEDDVKVQAVAHSEQARSGGGNVLIRSTYTCDDGSGTFNELKHLQITFTEEGFTDAGPVEILGGIGAYAGIVGHGFGVGGTDDATGIGAGTTTGLISEHA
jgi:hypothetical protein